MQPLEQLLKGGPKHWQEARFHSHKDHQANQAVRRQPLPVQILHGLKLDPAVPLKGELAGLLPAAKLSQVVP